MALLNVSNASGKLLALTSVGTATAEIINQDVGDTDFESIRETRAVWNLANISDPQSTVDTLVANVPINTGDRLFLVKDNGQIFDFIAPAVTKSTASMIPNMTSATLPSGTVTGSDANAWKAFDGDNDTYMDTRTSTGTLWAAYQMPNNERIKVTRMYVKFQNTYPYPQDRPFRILASNDGTNWVTIHQYVTYSVAQLKAGVAFDVHSPGEFSYYRMDMPNSYYFQLSTFSFLVDTGDTINTSTITQGEIPTRVFKFEDKIKFNGNVALEKDIYYEYGTAGSKLLAFPIYHDVILSGRTLETKVEFSAVGNELKEITGQIYKALV